MRLILRDSIKVVNRVAKKTVRDETTTDGEPVTVFSGVMFGVSIVFVSVRRMATVQLRATATVLSLRPLNYYVFIMVDPVVGSRTVLGFVETHDDLGRDGSDC